MVCQTGKLKNNFPDEMEVAEKIALPQTLGLLD